MINLKNLTETPSKLTGSEYAMVEVLEAYRAEIKRLEHIVAVLIERAEQPINRPNSAFGLFHATVLLEDQVRARTKELESSLQTNVQIQHELVEAKQRVEQSEALLRNILESSPIGLSIVDKTHKYTLVNEAFCQIVGYSREALKQLSPIDITWPDDIVHSKWYFEDLLNNKIDHYQIEKRYRHADGHPVWVLLTVSVMKDLDQNPIMYIGQVEDISQKKYAEEQLTLASIVYQNSREAMMITDRNNAIIAINPAFTVLTGYSLEEVKGKNPRILHSGRHNADFYASMWTTLHQTRHWEGDVTNRKKNGELYTEWLSISAVPNSEGKIEHYVALFTDVTEERKAAETILRHANYDVLTKLPNRRLFHDRLEQAAKQSDRSGRSMALLFIDLDHFKEVNDTLGHQAGDALLVEVANRLSQQVRATDTISRMGGDEFTAILNEMTDTAHLTMILQNILNCLSAPFAIEATSVNISGSIGVILYPDDVKTTAKLIHGADAAMYASKQRGRNRYTFYSELALKSE